MIDSQIWGDPMVKENHVLAVWVNIEPVKVLFAKEIWYRHWGVKPKLSHEKKRLTRCLAIDQQKALSVRSSVEALCTMLHHCCLSIYILSDIVLFSSFCVFPVLCCLVVSYLILSYLRNLSSYASIHLPACLPPYTSWWLPIYR